jgi:hypothetical protein
MLGALAAMVLLSGQAALTRSVSGPLAELVDDRGAFRGTAPITVWDDGSLEIGFPSKSERLSARVGSSLIAKSIRSPALIGGVYEEMTEGRDSVIRITPNEGSSDRVKIVEFVPTLGQPLFSYGSPDSIRLAERPMVIELRSSAVSTGGVDVGPNGNSSPGRVPALGTVGISVAFDAEDHSGQQVWYNEAWLRSQGIENPAFRHEDGTAIQATREQGSYRVQPEHFSVIHTFDDTPEGFGKVADQPKSNVYWDAARKGVYWLSDRNDYSDEIFLRMHSPVSYGADWFRVKSSFVVYTPSWYVASYPLAVCGEITNNQIASSPNCIQFTWINWGGQHRVYMAYRDNGNSYRISDFTVITSSSGVVFSVEAEFARPTLTLRVYQNFYMVKSVSYTIGTGGVGGFYNLNRVIVAADGSAPHQWPEYPAAGLTTEIVVEGSLNDWRPRNPTLEYDTNSDGTPDYWTKSGLSNCVVSVSTSVKRSGSRSVAINDQSSAANCGIFSETLAIAPGKHYMASAWVYAQSRTTGQELHLQFSDSSGSLLPSPGRNTMQVLHALWTWQEIRVTAVAPAGAARASLVGYSTPSNVGLSYWDDFEFRELPSFWAVNLNTWEVDKVKKGFDHIAALGARYARMDFAWSLVEPSRDQYDQLLLTRMWDALGWASDRGLEVIVILGGAGNTPQWAKDIWFDWEFLDQWKQFCREVGSRFGARAYYYQITNEQNHASHQMRGWGQSSDLIRNCFDGLVEGEGTTMANHKRHFKTIVNAFVDWAPVVIHPPWETALRDLLQSSTSGPAIDIAAIDHYPGSWNSESPDHWTELDTLGSLLLTHGKEGAVMETGRTTLRDGNGNYCAGWGEQNQVDVVNLALGTIKTKAAAHNAAHPQNRILMTVWFQLMDHNTDKTGGCNMYDFGNMEAHWGVMKSHWSGGDWTKKQGYLALHDMFTNNPPL